LADRGINDWIHFGQSSGKDDGSFRKIFQIIVGSNTDPFLLGGENDSANFHFFGKLIGVAPIHGNRSTQIERDRLEFKVLAVAKDEPASLKAGMREICA
jgi:hypothetical protein